MGPISLNKDNLVNKAGIEVEIIPVRRSPCPSPAPKRKDKRARSELGFYTNDNVDIQSERGSLPDLLNIHQKGSITNTIMQLDPNRFLGRSSKSLSGDKMSRSLGSTELFPKGTVVNAVKNWLEKSNPFSSTECLETSALLDTGSSSSEINLETENFTDKKPLGQSKDSSISVPSESNRKVLCKSKKKHRSKRSRSEEKLGN